MGEFRVSINQINVTGFNFTYTAADFASWRAAVPTPIGALGIERNIDGKINENESIKGCESLLLNRSPLAPV